MHFSVSEFFRDITSFVKYRRVLGVDIGTVALKAVELERRKDDITLLNYAVLEKKDYLDRANEAIQTTSLKLSERDTVQLLKTLLREMKPTADSVVASIPLFGVFVVTIEMPLMSAQETKNSILYQARQYIPIAPEAATLDWVKVEEFDTPKGQRFQRVLLTAMPNELVEKYKAIFRAAGLHLVALEVESHPLIRAGLGGEKGAVLIMDIGAESTGYSIVEGGALKQVAQTDYGGAALTHALGRSLDISAWRAEELKKRRGLVGFGGDTELSTSLEPFLDVILQEGERVRGTYERTMGRKIQNVMLVGGGANLPGLADFVKGRMQATMVTPRPFAKVKYPPELEPAMRDLSNTLTLAAGLALKFYA